MNKIVNPMGLDGFEFLVFTSPNINILSSDFNKLGFKKIASHNTKDLILYQQENINFIIDYGSKFSENFSKKHGSSAMAMGFKVQDAILAHKRAISLGAENFQCENFDMPAIYGIGGSLIYFIDDNIKKDFYKNNFDLIKDINYTKKNIKSPLLLEIDHLTHNVHQGNMDKWVEFYEKIFNFSEIRNFDIEGKKTGLLSRAMGSPCGKIKIPINESKDDKSQIEEFIKDYNGEGIQHIALSTNDIYQSVALLRENGIDFLNVPDTYYEALEERIKNHNENKEKLHKLKILIDGNIENNEGILLQIFTQNMLGPIFFEIIQRKGNDGFGEGNFQALFEAIERDQINRGVL